ncbi:MAG: L-aspartate oxidase [Polyangiaceae bacterium]
MAITTDCLVLGSGIAGLTFALTAAAHGSVLIVTKRGRDESSTAWAQGGVAAVLSADDSFERHVKDTLTAGAGLCHDVAVELCVKEGPAAIQKLVEYGVPFSKDEKGELDLGREGGHTARRVAHAGDITGREIERTLLERAAENPNIQILEWHMGVDLIMLSNFGGPDQCVGAYVLDEKTGRIETVLARTTVIATGGAGKVYLYTSNPDVATGDGVAMAYRAGAEIANMEFYQFHPTVLHHSQARTFLISEALRGEGAILRHPDTLEPFMKRHHEMADLAPRDIVARAIDYEMKKSGSDYVLLDITHKPASFVRERFPNIHAECLRYGMDMTVRPLPVVPAAHYLCGGITSDLHGRTSLPGLMAIGESACTGLHGANRLASNSLLEGLVLGRRAAEKASQLLPELRQSPWPSVPDWQIGSAVPSDEAVVVTQNWDELRRVMWNFVGIVRSDTRLRRAARRVALLEEEIREYYWKHLVNRDLLELRNIATVAELIISSAASRKESRGLHSTLDYPETRSELAVDTVCKRGVLPHLRGH